MAGEEQEVERRGRDADPLLDAAAREGLSAAEDGHGRRL